MKTANKNIEELKKAFDYYNEKLFSGKLEDCYITIQKSRHWSGYFKPKSHVMRDGETKCHTICIESTSFFDRDERAVASTLVHEMMHLWQYQYGKYPKTPTHNKEFIKKLEFLGFKAVKLDKTGRKMTQEVKEGGLFARANEDFKMELDWTEVMQEKKPVRGKNKTPYKCTECNYTVYGKEGLAITCIDCDTQLDGGYNE